MTSIIVSIPQSEFCPLGLHRIWYGQGRRAGACFNSSVGILSVGTKQTVRCSLFIFLFQFLSRNSVRWDPSRWPCAPRKPWFQFLSRNSVRWDLNRHFLRIIAICAVSIPQSEFCPLGLPVSARALRPREEFQFLSRNSVRWDRRSAPGQGERGGSFQFLSRNSVRWDVKMTG